MNMIKNLFQWIENKVVRSVNATEINKKDTVAERYYKTVQKMNEVSYLPTYNSVAMVLCLFFIFLDYVCIYQLVSGYMVETVLNSVMLSLGIAITIDISPSILAGCIRSLSDKPKEERKVYDYVGVIVIPMLITFFVLMAFVRIHSQDMIFSTADTGIQSAIGQAAATSQASKGTLWMSYLFIFVPIATSIITFAISISSSMSDKKDYVNNVTKLALIDEITENKMKELEAQQLLDKNLKMRDKALFELEKEKNRIAAELAMDLVELEVAKALQDPQAADEICGGNSGNS